MWAVCSSCVRNTEQGQKTQAASLELKGMRVSVYAEERIEKGLGCDGLVHMPQVRRVRQVRLARYGQRAGADMHAEMLEQGTACTGTGPSALGRSASGAQHSAGLERPWDNMR